MAGPHLERLRAQKSQKRVVGAPSKPSKPGFEGFEGAQRRDFSDFLGPYDGRAFLAKWGEQAEAHGWTARNPFGLHKPEKPHPSYSRLSRYDEAGLVWLLCGREVVALNEGTAAIQNPATASITKYRRFDKPALGPLGDSLEDFTGGLR
jgi:hypothetical protein